MCKDKRKKTFTHIYCSAQGLKTTENTLKAITYTITQITQTQN